MEHQDPNHRHRHQQINRSQDPNHRHHNTSRARALQQNRRPTPEKDDTSEFATISSEGFANMKPMGFAEMMQAKSDYYEKHAVKFGSNNSVAQLNYNTESDSENAAETPSSQQVDSSNYGLDEKQSATLDNAKAGQVVEVIEGEPAVMLDNVTVTPENGKSTEISTSEKATNIKGEKTEAAKIVGSESLAKAGEKAEQKAADIETNRKESGLLKSRDGKETKVKTVKRKVKEVGVSGREEFVTRKTPKNVGKSKPVRLTKGVEDYSTVASKGLKSASKGAKAVTRASGLLDFAFLGKAMSSGDMGEVVSASPLGPVTEGQIAQTEDIFNDVNLAKLNDMVNQGASPNEVLDFLENHVELGMQVIFSNNSESEQLKGGTINNLEQLKDPYGYESTENAHLIFFQSPDASNFHTV